MTRIYLFCGEGAPLPEAAAALLPPWRRQRLEALRAPGPRQESLRAGLLFSLAMEKQGLSPGEPVRILPAGKPVLAEREDVYFSLSHSGDWALCALGDKPVGADVQKRRKVSLSLARRLHPAEAEWLLQQPEDRREEAFFRLWTRKEAWVKCESGPRVLSLSETDVIHPPAGRFFRDWAPGEGYAAAVCAREAETAEPVTVTREELLARL